MSLFDAFTSDTHYFHKRILQYCNRPFRDVGHQTEQLIKNYNDRIGHKDHVLWLGDNSFGSSKQTREVLSQLNGKKSTLVGNHCPQGPSGYHQIAGRGFEIVADTLYAKWEGRNIVMCHYDQAHFRSAWDDRYLDRRPKLNPGDILFHGHTHQKSKLLLNQIHLGVDGWDYFPAMYSEVAELIKQVPKLNDKNEWPKEYFQEAADLQEYRRLITLREQLSSVSSGLEGESMYQFKINQDCYDKFRCLGWEKVFEKRTM